MLYTQTSLEHSQSYSQVKNKPNKPDCQRSTTYVKWCDRAEQDALKMSVTFHTIGETEVTLPPKLPLGYEMEWHDSWDTLVKRIYNKYEAAKYDFDYLDCVIADRGTLYRLGIKLDDELIQYRLHPEYVAHLSSIADGWMSLKSSVDKLYRKLTDRSPSSLGVKPERKLAPDLKTMLEIMLSEVTTPKPSVLTPELLGKAVRDAWIEWAQKQDNPKEKWLESWETIQTTQPDQVELDIKIGLAIAKVITQEKYNERTTKS